MTAVHVVAADALIFTPNGPAMGRSLPTLAGLMVIDRQGRVAESAVVATRTLGVRSMVTLLTDAGELTLDERSVVTTRRGRMFAIDVARQVRGGGTARIETARVTDLPVGDQHDARSAVRAALTCMDPPVIRIPGALDQHAAAKELLEGAGVLFSDVSDERWTVFTVDPSVLDGAVAPPSIADLALRTLTAWGQADTTLVSRTTLEQSDLRRRLLAALGCARTPGHVRWLPGYRPVEARVSPGAARPYAVAKAALIALMPAIEVELSIEGSVISDFAIVAAPPARQGA
jgi:hypothetical protein